MWHPLLSLHLVTVFVITNGQNSGIKFRLTTNGLSYANKLAQDVLNAEIQKIKLPRINVPITGGPGYGQLEINKIKFTTFQSPEYSYQLRPPNGVQWSSKNGRLTLKADWTAWYKVLIKFSFDGQFSATLDNIQIFASMDVLRDKDGRAQVKVPVCHATVGTISVKLSGGVMPKLINLFKDNIATAIRNAIENQLCKKVQTVLVEKLNAKIRTMPTKIPIKESFFLDYTLAADPSETATFVEAGINGSITYKGQPSKVTPPDMPETPDSERMVYFWVTDFVPNSLFDSAQRNDLLKRTISKDTNPEYANMLRTTCPKSQCIGTLIKDGKIGQLFPNTSVLVDIWSTKTPELLFKLGHSDIDVEFQAKMYAEPKSEHTLLLHIQLRIQAEIRLYINYQKVVGNCTVKPLEDDDLKVLLSNIGEFDYWELYVIRDIVTLKLNGMIDDRLSRGFVIPPLEHVQLLDPKIKLLDRAIQIEADVKYKEFDH